MPLPEPRLGLVVRYVFVWAGKDRTAPPDHGKDRPCLIVGLRPSQEPALRGRLVMRVVYLPISHTAPRDGESALAVPPRVAQHLGFTDAPSFIYTPTQSKTTGRSTWRHVQANRVASPTGLSHRASSHGWPRISGGISPSIRASSLCRTHERCGLDIRTAG